MGKRVSVLSVDDDLNLSKTMSLILGRKGYAVTTARDGLEALERVKKKPFDMIFMDVRLPRMDGVEAYRRIKKIRPEAVVVMMTAYAVEDLVQEALSEGAYGVVYKPLDMEKIIALIENSREARQTALVLVVDDEPGTCITMRNILSRRGYEVGIAHTGEEAIAMAQNRAYEISFIDMRLPKMNGLETYLALRELDPGGLAIMMTGYGEEMADLVAEAINSHAYACLEKPLDMEEVLRLVDEIVAKKQGGMIPGSQPGPAVRNV